MCIMATVKKLAIWTYFTIKSKEDGRWEMEDVGFQRLMQYLEPRYSILSRKYIAEVVIPRMVDGVTTELHEQLGTAAWLSFTTDIWSTYVSSDYLLSLTVHWLTDSFERKSAVLHAEPLHGSHTGEVLRGHYHRNVGKVEHQ